MDISFFHTSPFYELAALLALAAGVGFIGMLLRQPMIVSFIAVGVLAGPSALGIIGSPEKIELLAELGIAVLLFLVGLKLDLQLIRNFGTVALLTGLGQILFTAAGGFAISMGLGLSMMTSLFVAIGLSFSSTIIIIKMLSDKKEIDALHGRIAIGILILQDIFVVLAMMGLSALSAGNEINGHGGGSVAEQLLSASGAAVVILAFVMVFIRFLATPFTARIARSPELLVTFAIAWAALFAMLGHHFGFSKELGGLLAGISLASTPFREAIVARLSSVRDFLLLFFFIALGAKLDLSILGGQVNAAIILSAFVLIGKPILVMVVMGLMGYRKRSGFLAGVTLAQISEFSLIFMSMAYSLGYITEQDLGLVTLVGLITIALSVYMINYAQTLYRWLEPFLGVFERKRPYREEVEGQQKVGKKTYDVILFGLGRYGSAMAAHLNSKKQRILAVDFNPDVVRRWRRQGYDALYGDASDPDLLHALPLQHTKWVVSTLPQHDMGLTHEDPRLALVEGLRHTGYRGKIAFSTQSSNEVDKLIEHGADVVFLPFYDAANRAVERMQEISGEEDFS